MTFGYSRPFLFTKRLYCIHIKKLNTTPTNFHWNLQCGLRVVPDRAYEALQHGWMAGRYQETDDEGWFEERTNHILVQWHTDQRRVLPGSLFTGLFW